MFYVHPDLEKRVEDRRRREAVHRAETWRLLHQARRHKSCWLLCQMGHLLVQLGRRLQEYGSPQPLLKAGG